MKKLGFGRWILGSVEFRGEGAYPERFLNLAAAGRLKVWNVREKDGVFSGRVYCRHYRALALCGKKSGMRIRIAKKRGLPFLLHRYRKRWGVGLGLLLFAGLLILSQNFIWQVEYPEMAEKDQAYLEAALEEMGVCEGAYIKKLDIPQIQRDILMKMEDLSWIALNIDGTKLTVELSQKVTPPEPADRSPYHVVAKKPGVISGMEVYEGKKMVKVNDVVKKGQLLVSGLVEVPKGERLFYTNAGAKIYAQTSSQTTLRFALNQEEKVFTGQEETRFSLYLFGLKIPLYIAFPMEQPYEKEAVYDPLKVRDTPLPLGIWKETYAFYEPVERAYTEEEAKEKLLEGFAAYEKEEHAECEILNREDSFRTEKGEMLLTRRYTCKEDIAQRVKVSYSESAPPAEEESAQENSSGE